MFLNKRKTKIGLIIISIAFLIFFVINPLFELTRPHSWEIRARKKITMLNMLRSLAIDIKIISDYTKESPPTDINSCLKYIKSYYANYLRGDPIEEQWYDSHRDEIVDLWGSPIYLISKSPTEYAFISSGPNHIYENGKGDDIVFWFNPISIKEENANIN